jgi:hypothetical protein
MKKLLCILAFFAFATASHATTYYVAASGLDSNSGTSKTTPWLHAPGMSTCTSVCASTTINAGDSIIFRGGDTWHFGNSSLSPFAGFQNGAWNMSFNGTTTNCKLNPASTIVTTSCVYIGVDMTWYSGGSWTRPILNMDNPTSTSSPSSCSYQDDGKNQIFVGNYIIMDNFEVLGYCWNTTNPSGSVFNFGSNYDEFRNIYVHGWTEGTGCSGTGNDCDEYAAFSGLSSSSTYSRIDYCVIDGSDSTFFPHLNASGNVFNVGGEIDHNYVGYASNGMKYDASYSVHDNIFHLMFEPNVGGTHGNIMEWSPATGGYPSSTYFYNNLMNTTNEGEGIDMYPGSASSSKYAYVFNNISYLYRVQYSSGYVNGTDGSNCYMTEGDATGGPGLTYHFNNTTDSPCAWVGERGSPSITGQNNHLIGYTAFTGSASTTFASTGSTSGTVTDNGNEVIQTESVANGQGYVPGNNYAPTSSGNATVHAGANLSSLCSGMDNAEAATACTYGYAGVTYNSTTHTVTANTPNARGTTWDAGAYQFSGSSGAGTPSCTPGAGNYSTTQSVTCSVAGGAPVICYTTNGTTPATNGSSGCTTGTLYSSAINISATTTLEAIAGGTGYTDGSVASYTYTFVAPGSTASGAAKWSNGAKIQ